MFVVACGEGAKQYPENIPIAPLHVTEAYNLAKNGLMLWILYLYCCGLFSMPFV